MGSTTRTVLTSSTVSLATWRSSPRGQLKCSRGTWRSATVCSRPARTTAAIGSSARGARMSSPRGMDHHYVDKVEAFDVATDGACKADRPEGQKNKKWHPTDCSQLTTATAHPLKKPAAFEKCLAEMS